MEDFFCANSIKCRQQKHKIESAGNNEKLQHNTLFFRKKPDTKSKLPYERVHCYFIMFINLSRRLCCRKHLEIFYCLIYKRFSQISVQARRKLFGAGAVSEPNIREY